MREQRSAMEKELGGMQAKAQGSYQELQTMQIKVRALNYRNEFSVSNFVFFSTTLHVDKHEGTQTIWHSSQGCTETESCCCCCCCCIVPADEGAAGKPDHPTAAGEWYPEGRSQLCHQPDGEQVSVAV